MKTLVFLHGWGAAGNIWRGQVEAWAGQGFKVLAPNFPAWEAAWLADYLQELPLAETVLVGWSLGGMLLLEALSQGTVVPAGLVLVAAPASFCARPDYPWGQPQTVVRALRQMVRQDPRRGLADFAGRCLAPGETDFFEDICRDFQPRPEGADLVAGLDYLLNADLRPCLSRVPPGVLIIQGGQDAIVPPAQTEALRPHLRDARVVTLPGAGHVPFLTRAAAFNEILAELVGGGVHRPLAPSPAMPVVMP